jgi:hypothetical protein
MYKNLLLIALGLFLTVSLSAQKNSTHPEQVFTSIKSDVTRPLGSMKIILAGEKTQVREISEVNNPSAKPRLLLRTKSTPAVDPVVQKVHGTKQGQVPMVNINGIGDITGAVPSDACGAVGINHYVQVVNCAIAVWDKSGNLLYGPVATSTLWDGFDGPWKGTNDGDGIVLYDKIADRWLVTQFSVTSSKTGPYYQLIAVSETGDPLGAWHRYAYSFDLFNDYPKFGIWPDGYYSTYEMFEYIAKDSTYDYKGSSVRVFDRRSMLEGKAEAGGVYFNKQIMFSALPGDLDGPEPPANIPNIIVGIDTTMLNLALYEIKMDWANPDQSVLSQTGSLEMASFTAGKVPVPQPKIKLSMDTRPYLLMYRLPHRYFADYQVLLTNQTMMNGGSNAIRWTEMRKYTGRDWTFFQQGTYSPDSLHRWMGSIAMNGKGEIALGYTAGGSGKWASARYTGRTGDDDLETMSFAEAEPATGGEFNPFSTRWGDYSCMSVDPVNDETFWYTSQYAGGNSWKTNIVAFNLGIIPEPIVDAGNDTTVCSINRLFTNPVIANAKTFKWSSTGTGNLLWANERVAQYRFGKKDIENGKVDLILTAWGYVAGSVSRDTLHVKIALCSGINETKISDQVDVYPNPSRGVFNLSITGFENQPVSFEVLNSQGKQLFKQQLNNISGNYNNQIDLSRYPSGNYIIRIAGKDNLVVKKLIKN